MKIPCPHCAADFQLHGEITCVGYVHGVDDAEGKDRADLILACEECGTQFNSFVAISDFQRID